MFVPPIVLLGLGLSLISQPGAFAPEHELVTQAINERKASERDTEVLSVISYRQTRLATSIGGSDFVVVNKHRPLLPINYQPTNLREIATSKNLDNSRGLQLADQAATEGIDDGAQRCCHGAAYLPSSWDITRSVMSTRGLTS